MQSVHHIAQLGFGTGTNDLYDRARPSYQSAAISFIRGTLNSNSPSNVVEIGAGTGIFTRALLAHPEWSNVINKIEAVEPSEGMREVFRKTVTDKRVSMGSGTFDCTNVDDGWADVIVIAQAFHWCPDYDKASAEFARILKPNGVVAFIWNLEDRERAQWVAQIRDLIEQHEGGSPQFRLMLWRQTFDTQSYKRYFEPPIEKVWSFVLPGTLDIVVERASSKILAKSDELYVSHYANPPIEVKHALRNADFYREAFTGEIDTLTGFALVASVQTCFVWQHAQAIKGIPTCYIFSCPYDNQSTSPPFHALVPYGPSREPGLLLVSQSGSIRFWDSIGNGLAGGTHFYSATLGLNDGQEVSTFIRADSTTFIASTTFGSLYRLSLTSSGGDEQIKFHLFSRPSPSLSLSRLIPSIFSSSTLHKLPEPGNISSIALGARTPLGGQEIWDIIETRIQKWNMHPEEWEELILDVPVYDMLVGALRVFLTRTPEEDLGLELLDLVVDGDGKVIILVSYAGAEEETYMPLDMSGLRHGYALIRLVYTETTFEVDQFITVPYQTTSLSGTPTHPRIQLILGGVMICVQFGDAVALCARDSEYRNRLELKSATDRTLGVGVIHSDSTCLILTATTMMRVFVDIEKIQDFNPEVGHTNIIKSIMTQAILYGASPENPLRFSFPPDVDEEYLMRGAEQLSQAILQSDPSLVKKDHDLSSQMTARKEKLSWLIGFINDNAVLVKMSQKSRQKLAIDAEKLYAGYQLWLQYNEFLASSPTHSVLNDAVHAYMEDVEDTQHEDVMRAFFRFRIDEIGKLIRKIIEVASRAPTESGVNLDQLLPETNRAVLTVLRSALEYRNYNLGVYGVELPMVKPWTSRPAVIDAVLGLFDATTKVVEKPLTDGSVASPESEPNSQLPELAEVLFACVQERLDWLGSNVAANDPNSGNDKDELDQKFTLLRPEVFETLRRNGHAEAAFALAEKYRDFSSLAALCHRDTIYPPEDNPNIDRIEGYLERFKEEFAQELYKWYIHHGELRVMFAQPSLRGGYMDKFFATNPNNAISWLNDLGKERYGSAAASLLAESKSANNLEVKHLMLSIGKLAHLAETFADNTLQEDEIFDAFHDDLDFVSVHENVVQGLKAVLGTSRGRQPLDSQVDTITKAKATLLTERRKLFQIFKDLVRQLLQGKVLSTEDLVDVLTLKNNTASLEDYAIALQLLGRSRHLPEARHASAFRTVWRRVYIHDDWDLIRRTTNISDSELTERFRKTALYVTLCAVLRENQTTTVMPDEALMTPGPVEINSRWSGMSTEEVEAVVEDYDLERDRLGEYDLSDVYHRVRELALQDIQW
ncbi:hypothetical protein AMATHDRAFT_72820 [Amanita thiersii Skay4041]|uniref:Methyltransferase type 11 domain-containing protein n=1 Tax=Amanita thiersii Skay4041 TaxID=703135 RepID=A0A2A9P160_9AGAR|nr:hypothetical protein AMATHDRAFT_72820 [Amanita thiersii Skay4041]